jgi:short-subunit dehydrogenase/pimeloyl-ACP methyl ester carboxylesterase
MVDGAIKQTVSSGAIELAVVEAGDPQRPTIVLVHGYPDTKELWAPILERLAGRYHVVAYDVRGAGASSTPHGPKAYDYERLTDDLLAVAAARAPGKQVHLVGHDWGAIQGWEFATSERLDGSLKSFTAIAGPSLDHLILDARRLVRQPTPANIAQLARRLRRSWYVPVLWSPGGPTVAWRGVLGRGLWKAFLQQVERVPVDVGYPAPTLASNGRMGANLYRRNIPRRLLRPRRDARARVPVQLVVPTRDHFIATDYYDSAARHVSALRRRLIGTTHWAPRTHPELIARWISEFVDQVEAGAAAAETAAWVPGAGVEQLAGRLALVTGAGSGIGRSTALALSGKGARLLLVDRDVDGVQRTAAEIAGAHAFVCDVSDQEAMEQLANRVLGEHGVPDVVINNAGIGVAGPVVETELADLSRIVDVNLKGVIYGCRLFGRAMVERGAGGQIVNTASMAAFTPTKDLGTYAATKAAVLMFSESLRAGLAASRIGVTAVCPGFIATNITRATRFVGASESDQERRSELVTRIYERRNFGPDRVAAEIVQAIGDDRPVAVVTPEAKAAHALSRFAPDLMRRLAQLDTLPT